jgi:ABC-type dipeptide/oligopeptide/nickel transport system permease subunit
MSMQASEILAETTHVDEEVGGSVRAEAWRRLRRNPAAIAGALLVLLFLLVAVLANVLAPYGPTDQVALAQIRPGSIPGPSADHLLGVDHLGRDELSRLLHGSMLAHREADYVLAARSVGVRQRQIVFGHIMPNSLSPVLVQGTLLLATAIIDAAALSYLGLGTDDPGVPGWGGCWPTRSPISPPLRTWRSCRALPS